MMVIEQSQPDDEIDLFEFFSSLMQQWRWVSAVTVVGVVSVIVTFSISK